MNKHLITVQTQTGQEKFSYLAVKPDNIPEELKKLPHWVLWYAAQPLDINKSKKPDKIPITCNFKSAKSNDPKTGTDFDTVYNTYKANAGQKKELIIYQKKRTGIIAGIGFILSTEQNITGIDIDKCIDNLDISDFAQDVINSLDTYTEISPSGTGIRSFVIGNKPDGSCKHDKSGFEIYNTGRFLTVTGQKIHGKGLRPCQDEINKIHAQVFAKPKKIIKKHIMPVKFTHELLEKAFASSNGSDLKALYDGIFEGDQSTADLKFCNALAFWFGKNYSTMDAVFRSSGLMRDKWDKVHVRGMTYGEATLNKAIENCSDCYMHREFDDTKGTYTTTKKTEKIEIHLTKNDSISPFEFPDTTDKFKPLSTKTNLEFLLNKYGIVCRYNEIKKDIEIKIPWSKNKNDNQMNCAFAEILSLCALNSVPKANIQDYLVLIGSENSYNPVADWILSKKWDGKSRMQDICDTIVSDMDKPLKQVIILKWLLSCVASLFEETFNSHGVLVFVGGQGIGKTSWFRKLVNSKLNAVLEGAIIDPMNKDTIINATSHWLVELGELDATFRKSDISRLKSFITQTNDKIRRPYAPAVSEYPRRTVFFGSVNEEKYLVDDSGNRRWWTIPVTEINYNHNIDMQQLWAEMYHFYKEKHSWWLNQTELDLLNQRNEEHRQLDPIEEKICSSYDFSQKSELRNLTATDILIEIGFERPNKSQLNIASKILKKTCGEPKKTYKGRVYAIPARKIYHD